MLLPLRGGNPSGREAVVYARVQKNFPRRGYSMSVRARVCPTTQHWYVVAEGKILLWRYIAQVWVLLGVVVGCLLQCCRNMVGRLMLPLTLLVKPRPIKAGRGTGTISIRSRDSSSAPAEELKIRDPPLQLEDFPSQFPSLDPEFLKHNNKPEQEEKLPYSKFALSASSSNESLYCDSNDSGFWEGELSLVNDFFPTFDFLVSDPQVVDQSTWDPLVD